MLSKITIPYLTVSVSKGHLIFISEQKMSLIWRRQYMPQLFTCSDSLSKASLTVTLREFSVSLTGLIVHFNTDN